MPSSQVEVYTLGGTIACGEYVRRDGALVLYDRNLHGDEELVELHPQPGKIAAMVRRDVAERLVQEYFGGSRENIRCSEAEVILDSAEYRAAHLEQIVRDVRRKLQESMRSLVLLAGTDNAASLMHVLAEGVSPALLGDRAIVVAVAQHHASPNAPAEATEQFYPDDSEPVFALNNALYLAVCAEMRGRIGLLCGRELYGPRGILKIDAVGDQPFFSRFAKIARASEDPVPRWYFRERTPDQLPRGRAHEYLLTDGVEVWPLTLTSSYANLPAAINGMLAGKKRLRGLILQAPGSANLRQDEEELRHLVRAAERAAKAGVPIVVISDPLQKRRGTFGEDTGGGVYGGNLEVLRPRLEELAWRSSGKKGKGRRGALPIINGGELSRTEAALLTSAAVECAREQHGYRGKDIVEYTEEYLRSYMRFLITGDDATGGE